MTERALAQIDVSAIERNCGRLRQVIGADTKLCAVVKANSYGHGGARCAKAALAGSADWLAVAVASEAAELRREAIEAPILIMGALTPAEARIALDTRADVVIWDPEFAHAFAKASGSLGTIGRVHIKLDTGMGRLGTKDPEQALATAEIVEEAEHLQLVGLMTHFATADDEGDEFFGQQLNIFTVFARRFRQQHPNVIIHAANSAATFRDPAAHFDMVRCGAAICGLDPFQEDPNQRGLEQAITLRSYVAAVRRFEPGDSAGYARAWKADQPTFVGTLPIGYGDGWRREFTNNADILIGGRRYPLVGRVSTDNITVDLGPDSDVRPGTLATLIGHDGDDRITVEEAAKRIATINYDITCGLSERVRRQSSTS